jgi:hypothetical protein
MASAAGVPKGIATRLVEAPTSDFVYSSLSFMRDRFPHGIPGTWFVDALGEIGVDARAVRQTLLRMTKTGVLRAVRTGRTNTLRADAATWSILDAGRARVSEAVTDEWDEQWTIVHLRFEDGDREARDRLRDVMLVHGFGRLRSGVYLHPRDRVELVLDAATSLDSTRSVSVFRGHRYGPPADVELTRELWDVAALAARYRSFIQRSRRSLERARVIGPIARRSRFASPTCSSCSGSHGTIRHSPRGSFPMTGRHQTLESLPKSCEDSCGRAPSRLRTRSQPASRYLGPEARDVFNGETALDTGHTNGIERKKRQENCF